MINRKIKLNNKIKPYKCRGYLFILYVLLEIDVYQIAKECGITYHTIRYWLKKFNITPVRKICGFCGNSSFRDIAHRNIAQDIPEHHFCSKKCKINWIYRRQEINLKINTKKRKDKIII